MNGNVKRNIQRMNIEVGFIMVLFYANLFMGEFVRSGEGFKRGFIWALLDVFTMDNFIIAVITACFAYVIFEYLRNKFFK